MVKRIYNFFLYNLFKITKIDYHPQFYMFCVGYRDSNHRDRQAITMAMNVSAFAIVTIQCMSCFKTKLLGNSYVTHKMDLTCKSKDS